MIINGRSFGTIHTFKVKNPYTQEVVEDVSIANSENIAAALKFSKDREKDLSIEERIKILSTAADKIEAQKEEVSRLITSESGLSLKDTLYEVGRVANVLRYSASIVGDIERDITGRFVGPNDKAELKVVSEPLDLVVGITPFNHPMNQVVHKIGPSIAAGAGMVLKPSEKTPLSALKLVEILQESGLPPNYVNVVTTMDPSSFLDSVLEVKEAEMITFTGGVWVGKHIARRMAETGNGLVKYVPELGGNSALTILEDADIELAANCAMNAFANSGQRCTSTKRILVHREVGEAFLDSFLSKVEKIRYGDPLDPDTDMGTVINEMAAKGIEDRVNVAVKEGAKLLYGNKREGALYSPTVLDNVYPNSRLVSEETFGPVAPIIYINNTDEAIKIINSTNYKLAGGVITEDKKKAEYIANSIKVGQFNWNNNPGYRTELAPFGGFGDSGNGSKEGVLMAAEGMRRIRTFYRH